MSILSDRQIAELCIMPETIRVVPPNPNVQKDGFTTLLHYDSTPYDRELTDEEKDAWRSMISPFNDRQIRQIDEHAINGQIVPARKLISHGLTSYGYDVSLARDGVKIFTNIHSAIIDPKRFDPEMCLVDAKVHTDDDGALFVILPPHAHMLGRTVEYFYMPRDVTAICLGKSTYARCSIIVNATPIEAGWHGNVVIEIGNLTNSPAKIYLEEGISQFLFFRGEGCMVSYADRGGKYQGQTGVTLAKV